MASCGRGLKSKPTGKSSTRLLLFLIVSALLLCLVTALVACDGGEVSPPLEDDETDTGDVPPEEEVVPPAPKTFDGVTFEDESVVYDGNPHIITPVGMPIGTKVSYLYTDFVDVGEYQVVATLRLAGYETATLYATLTILPARIEVTFSDRTVTWDGAEHIIYVEGALPDDAIVTYECNGETQVGVYSAKDVGTYCVTAHIGIGKNYVPVDDLTATLTIQERAYVVSFVHWDGTVETREVYRGHDLPNDEIPANKPREGYTQMLWDPADIALLTGVTKDITVHEINGEAVVYDVILDPNGGLAPVFGKYEPLEGGKIMIHYTVDNDIELLPPRNFVEPNAVFLGWFDEQGKRVTRLPDDGPPRNMTLTARWQSPAL